MPRLIPTLIASTIGLILVLPFVIVLIPIWLFNGLVSVIDALLRKRATPWQNLIQFEPELGWRPRPNLKDNYFDSKGDCCSIETDREGWLGRHTIEASDVVVFGDSFAFGYGISARRAFFSVSQACRIKSFGAPGYSMVQQYLLMKRYAGRLRGKLVVWLICMENDLADNLVAYLPGLYTNPFLRTRQGGEAWEVVTEHVTSRPWLHGEPTNPNLFARLCTPSPFTDRVFSAARHLIRAGQEVCEGAGADLAIFAVPYKYQLSDSGLRLLKARVKHAEKFDPGYPEARVSEICRELGVPLLAGAADLSPEDYKVRDGHWNRRGNRRVAELIETYWRQRKITLSRVYAVKTANERE